MSDRHAVPHDYQQHYYGGKITQNAPLEHPSSTFGYKSWNNLVKESDGGKNVIWTSDLGVELPIRLSGEVDGRFVPETLIQSFQKRVEEMPSSFALHVKRNKKWVSWTWRQYWNDACTLARALIASGFQRRNCTAIMGFNSPEWLIAFFGTIFADGVPAGIYTTNNMEATKYIADHTESEIVFVDTLENCKKFIAAKQQDPKFKVGLIVLWLDAVTPDLTKQGVISWSDFMKRGSSTTQTSKQLDLELATRMENQQPGHACNLVYTSGTTGNPKGVILSHDNLTWLGNVLKKQLTLDSTDRIVSYLPLSHVASQDVDIMLPLASGCGVYFAQPDALKGSLVDTLKEVKPTVFLAVPRVWEKFMEKIRAVGATATGLKKLMADWAKKTEAEAIRGALLNKTPLPLKFKISDTLMKLVRANLGLDKCFYFISGAAPLPPAVQDYFMSLGIPICDLFGMSECTGPETFNAPAFGSFKFGSIGRAVPGTEIELRDADPQTGVGEVTWRGRNVFMGYLKNEPATRETFDMRGYMRSGDLGRIDSDGFVYITGRAKEIIITAGGENVAPVNLEENVKAEATAFISNVQVIGEQRKFLSCIVTLKSEVDSEGIPTTALTPEAISVFKAAKSAAKTTTDALKCPIVHSLVWEAIQRANHKAPSRAQKIQRFRLLELDFSSHGGELGPTLKLKRNVSTKIHEKVILDIYEDESDNVHPGGLKGAAIPIAAKI